ncbi:MAG: serine protease [Rickettsiaceae bacterium]|nr:serine protease [Rickettsiaceae bacterium]
MTKFKNILIFLALFVWVKPVFSNEAINIDKLRKSIVTVNSSVALSAYNNSGNWSGTGFIVDGKNGYIITNQHVVGRASAGTYFVTFYNGKEVDAKVVFVDEYVDFAILKINPAEFPIDYEVVALTEEEPELRSRVFIIGNTEGQGFSFHEGYLADLYEISGDMPQGSYIINVNSAGGSSGSPVLNSNNKAIGILYGGGKTHVLALKASYVTHALKAVQNGMSPMRKHIGVITELISLDKAQKHFNFEKNLVTKYISDFPNARNRVIAVRTTLNGSPAQGKLQAGDIIWKINGQVIAADLAKFDLIMNNCKEPNIKLTLIRNGKILEQEIALYSIEDHAITRMLDFAGALFFEADDHFAFLTGAPIGKLSVVNVQTGSSFGVINEYFSQNHKNLYRIQITELDGHKVNDLESLVKVMQDAINKKYVGVRYKNYLPYYTAFNSNLVSAHEELIQSITFDSTYNNPRILTVDRNKMEWIVEKVINE